MRFEEEKKCDFESCGAITSGAISTHGGTVRYLCREHNKVVYEYYLDEKLMVTHLSGVCVKKITNDLYRMKKIDQFIEHLREIIQDYIKEKKFIARAHDAQMFPRDTREIENTIILGAFSDFIHSRLKE